MEKGLEYHGTWQILVQNPTQPCRLTRQLGASHTLIVWPTLQGHGYDET